MKKKWLSWDIVRTETYDPEKDINIVTRLLSGEVKACLRKTPPGCTEKLYREYRRNWGQVYRSLRRLYRHNYIVAYWFFRSGKLKLTWWEGAPKTTKTEYSFRYDCTHNIQWLYCPSEREPDKRPRKDCYAAFRPTTAARKPPDVTLMRYTPEILAQVKIENFKRKLDLLKLEIATESAGAFGNWDQHGSQRLAKKYSKGMAFWEPTNVILKRNQESR